MNFHFFTIVILFVSLKKVAAATHNYYFNWTISANSFKRIEVTLSENFVNDRKNLLQHKSYSQVKQDLHISKIFRNIANGYFVDLAANHYRHSSNSFLLEVGHDWKGICIEPNPKYHESHLIHRTCRLFVNPVSATNGEIVKFRFKGAYGGIVGAAMDNKQNNTSMDPEVELPTVTLTSILEFMDAPVKMEYLSLDVEGAEYPVMQGFNFEKYTFLSMTVERPKIKLHSLLVKHGYVYVCSLSGFGDILYVHHSLPNLEEVLREFVQDKANHWKPSAGFYEEILLPRWQGNLAQYLTEADLLYRTYHPDQKH